MSVLIEKCKQISEGYNQERELLMMQNQRLSQEMEIMQNFVNRLLKMAEQPEEQNGQNSDQQANGHQEEKAEKKDE